MEDDMSAAELVTVEKWGEPEPVTNIPQAAGELAPLREELNRRLDEIEALVRRDRQKDEQLARQHEELQQFRSGELDRRQDPLLLGIIRIYDEIGRAVAAFREIPLEELSAEKILKQFSGIEEDIELLLENHEVAKFREETEVLVPQRQLAVRVENTDDADQVGRLAARLRPGFRLRERILVKERVAVFARPKSAV